MIIAQKALRLALVAVCCAFFSAVAGLLICPQCGYENPDGAQTCTHCNAQLTQNESAKKADAEAQSATPSGVKGWHLNPEVVEKEIVLAGEYLARDDKPVARFLLKNAIALESITDPGIKSSRPDRIKALLDKCERYVPTVTVKCPLCGGTGKSAMKVTSLKGEVTYQEVPGRACQKCNGDGSVKRHATVDGYKGIIGAAGRRLTTLQQERKYAPVGGAWVPMDIEDKLTTKLISILRRTTAPACADCMGLGKADCKKCKGSGEVKCTNSKCVKGMVPVEEKKQGKTQKTDKTEKCKICNGRGFIDCSDCGGQGTVLCKKCGGSGESPLCETCGGKGLISCNKCGGAGNVKNTVCLNCRGEGVALCSACKGDGRRN